MLDGISDIAHGVQACKPGDLAFRLMMEELRATCSPMRRSELLEHSSGSTTGKQNICRAVKLLHKAAVASHRRNWARSFAMVRLALEAVDHDKQLVRDLLKANNLSFRIFPRRPVARDRHGLIDPRLTVVSDSRPRYGFAN